MRGYRGYAPADLEPGVKFFVLMLEQAGCETMYSCEGHPGGFYIVFRAPNYRRAFDIDRCDSVFTTELDHRELVFRLSLMVAEHGDTSWDDDKRCRRLSYLAKLWEKQLGRLKALDVLEDKCRRSLSPLIASASQPSR